MKARVAIAVGGILGATLRWAVLRATEEPGSFPWPVLLVNLAGSLVLGVILAEEWTHPRARLLLHDAGGIGFCGGATTFSTFAIEVVELLDDDRIAVAVSYAAASMLGTLVCVAVGAAALRRLRAITLPVEGDL